MTARAVCDHARAESRREAVIAVLVTADALAGDSKFFRQRHAFMTAGAGFSRDGGRDRGGDALDGRDDVVDAVTIGANRGTRHAARQRLAVDTLHELGSLGFVTLAARRRYVHLRDGRLRIRSGQDVVAIVAIGANGRAEISLRDGLRMHAFSIRQERTIADATALHYGLVAMTTAAGFSDV